MVKKMNWLVKALTLNRVRGITLAPFGIYIKEEYLNDFKLRHHEIIHWKQQQEMFVIFFYLWYFFEWVIKLFKYGKQAYMNISFEREAYANHDNFLYFKIRKFYAWFKYVR